jgi:hypothetical protein
MKLLRRPSPVAEENEENSELLQRTAVGTFTKNK